MPGRTHLWLGCFVYSAFKSDFGDVKSGKSSPKCTFFFQSYLVSEIYDYIDKNFTDTLSVSQLAVHFHHNADYLTRVFQRFSGYTIKQFILLKRISYAKELLQKGHLPNDVCFLCGFQNYSNFSRCFHNHLGLSPRKYQQSLSERTL